MFSSFLSGGTAELTRKSIESNSPPHPVGSWGLVERDKDRVALSDSHGDGLNRDRLDGDAVRLDNDEGVVIDGEGDVSERS